MPMPTPGKGRIAKMESVRITAFQLAFQMLPNESSDVVLALAEKIYQSLIKEDGQDEG